MKILVRGERNEKNGGSQCQKIAYWLYMHNEAPNLLCSSLFISFTWNIHHELFLQNTLKLTSPQITLSPFTPFLFKCQRHQLIAQKLMLFQAQHNLIYQSKSQKKPCFISLLPSQLCLTWQKSRTAQDGYSVFLKMVIILQTEHEGWNHQQIDLCKLGITSTTQFLIDQRKFYDQRGAETAWEGSFLPLIDPLRGVGSTQQGRPTMDTALFNTAFYTIIRVNPIESHHKNQALSRKWGRDSYTKNYGRKANFPI